MSVVSQDEPPAVNPAGAAGGAKPWSPRSLGPRTTTHLGVVAVLYLFVLVVLPSIVGAWVVLGLIQVAIYAIVCLGLGLLVGRVGLVSLGQAAVLAIGAWVGARLLFATGLPYEVVVLLTGLITMVIGTLVGLPALRLRGLYLALITLMLAGAITTVLATTNFPNGGGGFLGYSSNFFGHAPQIRRPGIAESDPAFLRYSIVVAAVMFGLVIAHLRMRPGRAWAAIRQSEAAALAAGINTTAYKLWAFALASFITGVAGALLGPADRYLYSINFQTQDSITLLAVVLMGGVYNIYGAIVAALLLQLLPAILNHVGVSIYWADVLFGVGALQVLTTAPAGIVDQLPKDLANLGRLVLRLFRRSAAPAGSAAE